MLKVLLEFHRRIGVQTFRRAKDLALRGMHDRRVRARYSKRGEIERRGK